MSLDKPKVITDLFGNSTEESFSLRERFLENPFSVLDSKGGEWQKRKQGWLALGIKSEEGRKKNTLGYSKTLIESRKSYSGTSVFDGTLTEIMYKWFCPEGGKILDPFAGGSVRGIIADYLKYDYTGIELREEQVLSNYNQADLILEENYKCNWICGDSDKILDKINTEFDFIFSCPPYFDLEVYSDLPDELSNMSYTDFIKKYNSIIKKSLDKLKKGSYAVFVVGEVRDKEGYYLDFVGDTKKAFINNGAKLYNDMVLLENGLNTAAMRAVKQFSASKKVVKVHQNVLCFKKIK